MKLTALALIGVVGVGLASPPSGRPPVGPLERYEPRVYDVKFEVTINSSMPYGQNDPRNPQHPDVPRQRWGDDFELADAPIVMPIIPYGTFHRTWEDSVRAQMWLGAAPDRGLANRFRIDPGMPHHGLLAVLPIERFVGTRLRWNVEFRMQSFSSRINDAVAAQIPWPREWPKEVADGLRPQLYIESDHEIFAQTVERVSEGNLRLVTPYLAAKDLVRYCINELQVTGNGLARGRMGILYGLEVDGALDSAADGMGSPHDLVCVCVAILRAAGIPARPVIGLEKNDENEKTLLTWAEFYLPQAGWVPFDPAVMRGKGIRHLDVHQPWPEFGTMKDLNQRVPLAYHFIPPRLVQTPGWPAVWGWDPRPAGAPVSEAWLTFGIVSRGRGEEDPR
jgi:transglutaminase-like putative cysteine protease